MDVASMAQSFFPYDYSLEPLSQGGTEPLFFLSVGLVISEISITRYNSATIPL